MNLCSCQFAINIIADFVNIKLLHHFLYFRILKVKNIEKFRVINFINYLIFNRFF